MKAIGIKLKSTGQIYYLKANNNQYSKNDFVVVKIDKALWLAKVVLPECDINNKNQNLLSGELVRVANDSDLQKNSDNKVEAKEALKKALSFVKKYNLDMRIFSAEYSLDKSQLVFNFTASGRIDFRDLVKELAAIYKTRIELIQIGVRDKAKEIDGFGQCGKRLCCAQFLNDFDSVSINMAKNQNIALNPNKINGVCGRLLCCLKYENDVYDEYKKKLPNIGKIVKTAYGEGKVVSLNILSKKYIVEVENYGIVECDITTE